MIIFSESLGTLFLFIDTLDRIKTTEYIVYIIVLIELHYLSCLCLLRLDEKRKNKSEDGVEMYSLYPKKWYSQEKILSRYDLC